MNKGVVRAGDKNGTKVAIMAQGRSNEFLGIEQIKKIVINFILF